MKGNDFAQVIVKIKYLQGQTKQFCNMHICPLTSYLYHSKMNTYIFIDLSRNGNTVCLKCGCSFWHKHFWQLLNKTLKTATCPTSSNFL